MHSRTSCHSFLASSMCHSSVVSMTLQTGSNAGICDVNEMQSINHVHTGTAMLTIQPAHLESCLSADSIQGACQTSANAMHAHIRTAPAAESLCQDWGSILSVSCHTDTCNQSSIACNVSVMMSYRKASCDSDE